jgi:hypothetical protein
MTGIKFVVSRPKGQRSTKVQSVLFSAAKWTKAKAKAWLKRYGFKYGKAEVPNGKARYFRFAQLPKSAFQSKYFRTIAPGAKYKTQVKRKTKKRVKAKVKTNRPKHINYLVGLHGKSKKYFDGLGFTGQIGKAIVLHDAAQAKKIAQALANRTRKTTTVFSGVSAAKTNPTVSTAKKIAQANELYESYSGGKKAKIFKLDNEVAFQIGTLDGVLYTPEDDQQYIHKFEKKRSRPLLLVSSDGKNLIIVGGRYQFTSHGIEDR